MSSSSKTFYPIAKPWITEDEISRVSEVLRSGNLSLGPKVPEFEQKFAAFVGTRHAAAVSSGTAGLHLCVRQLNLREGDEVITSPFSFIASSNCIVYERGVPRFVDIDARTLNMNPSLIEAAITEKTKAILVVHIFGYPADLDAIQSIAQKHRLPVIEDGCEALGATYHGKRLGSFGNPTVFAFYANKQMTTAEGGMIVTDNHSSYEKFKSLSNQGRAAGDSWLQHDDLGYNYRLSDVHCAIGISQLERLPNALQKRDEIARRYHELLSNIEELELVDLSLPEKRSWFIYPLWVHGSISKESLMRRLTAAGVMTRAYLPSIHLQPWYRQRFGYQAGAFPVSEDRSARGLALPFYIGLTDDDLKSIAQLVRQCVAEERRERKVYA